MQNLCVTLFRWASTKRLHGLGDDPFEPEEGGWTSTDILDGKTWILVRTNSGTPGADESNHGGIGPATVGNCFQGTDTVIGGGRISERRTDRVRIFTTCRGAVDIPTPTKRGENQWSESTTSAGSWRDEGSGSGQTGCCGGCDRVPRRGRPEEHPCQQKERETRRQRTRPGKEKARLLERAGSARFYSDCRSGNANGEAGKNLEEASLG